MNEADTCKHYVTPMLQVAGWDQEPHRFNEQVTLLDRAMESFRRLVVEPLEAEIAAIGENEERKDMNEGVTI